MRLAKQRELRAENIAYNDADHDQEHGKRTAAVVPLFTRRSIMLFCASFRTETNDACNVTLHGKTRRRVAEAVPRAFYEGL